MTRPLLAGVNVHIPLGGGGLSDLIKAAFYHQIANIGYVAFRGFSGLSLQDELPARATVLIASKEERVRNYLTMLDDCLVKFYFYRPTSFSVDIAGSSKEQVEKVLASLREHFPKIPIDQKQVVWMTFWYNDTNGAKMINRKIAVPSWEAIKDNYADSVSQDLAPLLQWKKPPGGGQLILWHGPPGTGKTYAIRTLAWEWRSWCKVEYITDPDNLFGGQAEYLIRVSLHADEDDDSLSVPPVEQWRLLLLEDTGEILSADAKRNTGQGLSRLLNIVDGLLGQGLRLLVMITTNEDLGKLHPAIIRPGRCLSRIKFPPLSAKEAQRWLEARGHPEIKLDAHNYTLAELYSYIEGREQKTNERAAGFRRS